MTDTVSLKVNGKKYERFLSYEIDSDLYVPADAFSLDLGAAIGLTLDEGMPCTLEVNGQLVLSGIIEHIEESDTKGGASTKVSGRDLLGQAVDCCCEQFIDLDALSLKAAAELLLQGVPLIERKTVRYELGPAARDSQETQSTHITPGTAIFDALARQATRRGGLLWCEPDGTLVFGKPQTDGEPVVTVRVDRNGGSNCLSLARVRDLSGRYRTIKVIAQGDGFEAGLGGQHTTATITDASVPLRRVLVESLDGDATTPARRARQLKEKQQAAGLQLVATMPRHSQTGVIYSPNTFGRFENAVRGWSGTYLITGRTFRLDKQQGQTTELRAGLPGVRS